MRVGRCGRTRLLRVLLVVMELRRVAGTWLRVMRVIAALPSPAAVLDAEHGHNLALVRFCVCTRYKERSKWGKRSVSSTVGEVSGSG